MPALIATDMVATVLWTGRVPGGAATPQGGTIESIPLDGLDLRFEGVPGDRHEGLTRPSCSRVLALHERGTPIRNSRQLSIVSREELELIARKCGLERLEPAWLGANLMIAGIPDFTRVPPSSRLQAESGATLGIDMENLPCQLPAKVIERLHPGKGRGFKSAAAGRRGVTAWVEREGPVRVGDTLRLFIPAQPAWPHLEALRSERAPGR